MKKALLALTAAAALTLTGCEEAEPSEPTGDPTESATVDIGIGTEFYEVEADFGGRRNVQEVGILCVEDDAFLYLYERVARSGGPAVERFEEQDAVCEENAS